jgi:hypothetical protein
MFLKLTKLSGSKVRINSEHISYYHLLNGGTIIVFHEGHHLEIQENPELMDKLLQDSYITIKEAYENRIGEIPQHPTNYQVDDSEQLQS